jgi:hypothetical protein
MSFANLTLAAVAATFLGSAAFAADTAPQPAIGATHSMAMRGMFTPEERMMLFADMFKATAGMSDDQKKEYRQQERSRIMAMSDADRAKFKADLNARWNALTAEQKADMTAKIEAFRAARHGGSSGQ